MKPIFLKKKNGSINNKSLVILVALSVGFLITYLNITRWHGPTRHEQAVLTQAPEVVPGSIVTLKRMKDDYAIDFHNMWSNTVRKNLEFPQNISLRYTIAYLKYQMKTDQYNDKKKLWYAIFDNQDNKLIGALEIRDFEPDDVGQFGCWVNENYWGGGRFQEAGKLIIKTYFALNPDIDSFIAHVRLWNERSYRALKKMGFKDHNFYYEDGEKTRRILKYYRDQ